MTQEPGLRRPSTYNGADPHGYPGLLSMIGRGGSLRGVVGRGQGVDATGLQPEVWQD